MQQHSALVSRTFDRPAASTALDRWALSQIQRSVHSVPVRFALWDGFQLTHAFVPPIAMVRFNNRRALWGSVVDPELNFGEGYMSGEVTITGDLLALLEGIYRALGPISRRARWWSRSNDESTARLNVHHHYDLGNAFYSLWLDREMVYTCAYFSAAEESLEDAQMAKMDLICRKLRLQTGDRVVEAGCGWGALALFMARRYGATVRAYNISPEQIAFARSRASAEGLARRVEFVEGDYRTIQDPCDVFVSVGMLEHVGATQFNALGDVLDRCLTPDGRGLLHFIGRNQPSPLNPWIRKRIFPGAYPPTLAEACSAVLEPHGFSVLDVENLRLQYARTLEHWRRRFEAAGDRVATLFDAPFVRAWRLYLAGSQAAFTTGSMQLFQVVFARGSSNAIPWTRAGG